MKIFDGAFDRYLDINFLRETGAQPHFFLDFIQLKLDNRFRMHFWHPQLPLFGGEEELHDHRYDFHSRVLVGSTTHEEWHFSENPEGDHELIEKSCEPGKDEFTRQIAIGNVERGGVYTMVRGSEYSFPQHSFHRLNTMRCVTLLERGEVQKPYARIVRRLGAPAFCPFETKLPLRVMWDIIEDLLKPEEVLPPGYHLREIPKGVFGEASKILEEAAEFGEAIEQGSRLMALIELSDMRGAIEGWLQKHHPYVTLKQITSGMALSSLPALLSVVQTYLEKSPKLTNEDLETFSQITQRAFRNGRR